MNVKNADIFDNYRNSSNRSQALNTGRGSDVIVLIAPGLECKQGLEYKPGSWFTYWSSLAGMHCLRIINVRRGMIWS